MKITVISYSHRASEVLSTYFSYLTEDAPVYHVFDDLAKFGAKFQREVTLFFEMSKFPYNTVLARSKEATVPKTSLIRSAVFFNRTPT